MADRWTPESWRGKPIAQVPEYPDPAAFAEVEANLRNFPPLVFIKEVNDLKARLAEVARGESFLLQGGDCAESFKEHKTDYIRDYFRLFLQMALILTFVGDQKVVKVGRVAVNMCSAEVWPCSFNKRRSWRWPGGNWLSALEVTSIRLPVGSSNHNSRTMSFSSGTWFAVD